MAELEPIETLNRPEYSKASSRDGTPAAAMLDFYSLHLKSRILTFLFRSSIWLGFEATE